jgi:hypothetical protein
MRLSLTKQRDPKISICDIKKKQLPEIIPKLEKILKDLL